MCGNVLAHDLGAALVRDVLVMLAQRRLGGRGEDRLGKLGSLDQALGELDAAHGAILVVGLLAGTGQVTAHDALDGDGLGLLHQHGTAGQVARVLLELLGIVGRVARDEVVGHQVGELVEPELGDAVQHLALEGNLIRQDVVESRDAVGCHHQQGVTRIVDIADLAMRIGTKLHLCHW